MNDAADAPEAAPSQPAPAVPNDAKQTFATPAHADAPPNSPEYVTVPSVQSSWGDTPQPPATAAAAAAAAGGWSVIGSPLLLPRGVGAEPCAAAKEGSVGSAGSAGSGRSAREDDKIDAEAEAEDDDDADPDAAADAKEWEDAGDEAEDETEEDKGDAEGDARGDVDSAAGDDQSASESREWTGPSADSDGDDGVDVAAALEATAKPIADADAGDTARPDVKTAAELAESEQSERDTTRFEAEQQQPAAVEERPWSPIDWPAVDQADPERAWGDSTASQRKTSAIVKQLKSEYNRKTQPHANPAPASPPTLRIPVGSPFNFAVSSSMPIQLLPALPATGSAKADRALSVHPEPPEVPVPLRAAPSPVHGESKAPPAPMLTSSAEPQSRSAAAKAKPAPAKSVRPMAPTGVYGPTPEEVSAIAMVRAVMIVLMVMLCALAIAPLGLRDDVTAMRQELDAVKSWASRANDTLALHGIDLNAPATPGAAPTVRSPRVIDTQEIRRVVLSEEIFRVLHDRMHSRTATRTATGCDADPTCKANEWFWTKWFGKHLRVDFATAHKWAKAFARERVTERHLKTLALKDLVALGLSTPQAKAFRRASGASKPPGANVLRSANSVARNSGGGGAAAHAARAYSLGLEAVRAVADSAASAAAVASEGATALGAALSRGFWALRCAVHSAAQTAIPQAVAASPAAAGALHNVHRFVA